MQKLINACGDNLVITNEELKSGMEEGDPHKQTKKIYIDYFFVSFCLSRCLSL